MTTLFTDRETTITASWLNSVDAIITDPAVTAVAGVTPAADTVPYFTGASTASVTSLSAFTRTILGFNSAFNWRIALEVQPVNGNLTAISGLISAADQLPYFTGDSTAALTTITAYARSFLASVNAADAITTLAITPASIGAQPLDAELTALATTTSAADTLPYFNGAGSATVTTLTAFGRSLIDDANAAAALTTLGAQPADAELTALAGVTSAADTLPYFTGVGTAGTTTLTAFGRSLIDDANAAAGLTTLGAAPLASPTFTGVPVAPTAAVDTNTTQLATTAFVIGQAYAKLASPTFTGTPAAPTAAVDTNTTQIATTAYVIGQAYAKLASPTFTGTVTLPTTALGNNNITGVKTLQFNGIIDDGNSSTADTIDFGAGQYHKSTLTGNCAYTFTAPAGPCVVQLEMIQDATGSRTYTTSPTLKWPASYAANDKLLSTAANSRDLLILRWNGTDYIANLLKGIA